MPGHTSQQLGDETPFVPVMSPRLPVAARLLPYLERIDASRIYTNYGPLVDEFEERLEGFFGLPAGGLVSSSSGTAALVGAILASAGRATPDRPFALMPAYTFVATAVAAEQCGFRPWLADIDADTLMLDPITLLAHPDLDRVGIVIPVAPYGIGVHQAQWRDFRERTGIPVVIDGAAGFETACADPAAYLGDIPVVMSFHATKSFACGEGGAVACSNSDVIVRCVEALNFGFHSSRNSRSPSTNGKMSEYHAAVGLAELDGWQAKCSAFGRVAEGYRARAAADGLGDRLLVAPRVCSSYVLLDCESEDDSANVQAQLQRAGVGYRLWYGHGLHRHTYFANARRENLDVTDRIAPRMLGLPMAPDLGQATIDHVMASVREGLATGVGLQHP